MKFHSKERAWITFYEIKQKKTFPVPEIWKRKEKKYCCCIFCIQIRSILFNKKEKKKIHCYTSVYSIPTETNEIRKFIIKFMQVHIYIPILRFWLNKHTLTLQLHQLKLPFKTIKLKLQSKYTKCVHYK